MEEEIKCKFKFGCHECGLATMAEDLRMLRYALSDLIMRLPLKEEYLQKVARSLITQINCWIEPRGEDNVGNN